MKHRAFLTGAIAVTVTSLSFPAFSDGLAIPVVPNTARQANGINPYELLELNQDQLAQRFPDMSQREREKLMFRIADINSMRPTVR
ncbi:hypothetical protein VW29_00520 [Devosia limi DSM 17137]|uniref:Uncharacterized protein n=1 Tax=Devosia limi DSM 17137 TaxID=1121477 RepID=A0A0F5LX76_9HYPH|nr:hypothetical protein [Devosia limi]KKB86779.1 hypothetical protein VW29_00520 [Devosia limi DSM 17137]SHF94834.1 hypothetical protein SAMN02745223_03974 [Devosia limi DSM 17137]